MSALPIMVDEASMPWRQFICRACGYIYDEKDGDPDGGLAPGTRYEDIPDDWACPLCGVSKQDFDPYDEPSQATRPVVARTDVPKATRTRQGVVIVGGGLAGWSVARALRSNAPDLPITLVAGDAGDVYPKPALSLAFGHGHAAADLITATGPETADALSVRLVSHAFAVTIDAPRRRLRTTRGSLDYDALVLATGARPIEVPSMPSSLCWRINALDTWTKLHAVLARGPARIAVIGAGLVGCELADDLAHAGHAVTVLDPASRPLAAWASAAQVKTLLDGWSRIGVRFVPSSSIARIERRWIGGATVTVIHCVDGDFHDADVVIGAIGLAIDPRLARSARLAIDAGIAVDETTMATSDPAIYAAGDCVSIRGSTCRFIEPIAQQAAAIAASIVGQRREAPPFKAPLVRLKTRSAPMTLDRGLGDAR